VGFIKSDIVQMTTSGLYCPAGDFYVDPNRRVQRAVITHAHSDHARRGMGEYVCSQSGENLLRTRVGQKAMIRAIPFGEEIRIGEARVSLHPAGHILGSAQVRIHHNGQTVVVTGDFNTRDKHSAAEPFEIVECDLMITESTFGLPVYRWPNPEVVFANLNTWWASNRDMGKATVLPCYPLGKTQRILAGLNPDIGPISVVGAGREFLPFYEAAGVEFPPVLELSEATVPVLRGGGFLIVSAAAEPSPLLSSMGSIAYGAVSGWLQVRKMRMGRMFDRGFVLSDHADWDGLLHCVQASGAKRVAVTHGQTEVFARYLRDVIGVDAFALTEH
jgi:putative mRNA 3-end processing factor